MRPISAAGDPIAAGVIAGLVAGKAVGILVATYLVVRFTRAELDEGLLWVDVIGVATLAGIGVTVSLLSRDGHVKVAILIGSLTAAVLASVLLRFRNAHLPVDS